MLPETLLCLLSAALILAQTRQELTLDSLFIFNSTGLPNPPSFDLPFARNLSISVALCSSSTSLPRFFVTNGTATDNPGPEGGEDVYEIRISNGYGTFTGDFTAGGILAVDNAGQIPFEVGISDGGPMHGTLGEVPLLGDTTANQVLLFSPPYASAPVEDPTYPNYTLPAANASLPSPPTAPNFTLIISPTSASFSLSQSACLLSSQSSTGTIASQFPWLRDEQGWRMQWIVEGLSPQTNYTAFVVQDGSKVSGPIYFVTKSASFSCPLVSSLPYCPNIAYAVPLSPLQPPSPSFYDASSVPSEISEPLIEYLTNFTTMLTTFACGRDMYSPIQTCADCQREYRRWLCTVSFMRCSEARPGDLSSAATTSPVAAAQTPLSALVPQSSSQPYRNPNFPTIPNSYTMLLPCLETCNAADRACPNFLGFQCPVVQFNAAQSYGVGFIDSLDGVPGGGSTGVAQDGWGNVWCNSG